MNHTTYTPLTAYLHNLRSVRDSIFYPVCIMTIMAICDVATVGLSWSLAADYIASIAILPLTLFISDYMPPHITHNYTPFTRPGVTRIINVSIFRAYPRIHIICH